jgi:hypothetical protein
MLAVSIESARLVEGDGIHLRGVRLRDPRGAGFSSAGEDSELAAIEEVVLECDTSLQRLVQGDVHIRRFVLRQPRLRLQRAASGEWNVEGIVSLARSPTGNAPPGEIEGGMLELIDGSRQPAARLTLRGIDLVLSSSTDDQGSLLRASGTLGADHLRRAEVSVEHRPTLHSTAVTVKIADLDLSPALLAALPREAAQHTGAAAALSGRADLDLSLAHVSGRQRPWQFQASARIHDGHLDHPQLPFALGQLQAKVDVSNEGLEIRGFTGTSRQTAFTMNARRQGWTPSAPMTVHLDARQLVFDQRMLAALPPAWQEIWRRFSPEGEADLTGTLAFDGQSWHPDLTLTARNVGFTYHRFPYPVQRTSGTLRALGKDLTFDLIGQARGVPVHVVGEVHGFGPASAFRVDIRGEKLRVDPELIAALPPASKALVQAFRPTGVFDLNLCLWRQPNDSMVHRRMLLRIHEAFGRYERFPYPLANVSGLIEQFSDDEWRFSDLQATSGAGHITCWGSMKPLGTPTAAQPPGWPPSSQLELSFRADRLNLDDELRAALPPATQRLWAALKPQGQVDLNVLLRVIPSQQRTSLAVSIDPWKESVSLEPAAFPYRWEKLRGQIAYADGVANLKNLTATHGDTTWRSQGQAKIAPDGNWSLSLADLQVDRLHVDRDLLRAAPERARQMLAELSPGGAFNLHGAVNLAQGGRPGDPLRAAWNLGVVCHGNSLHPGVKLDDIFGVVYLQGESQAGEIRGSGRLALDSATYRGFQFTDVRGPLTIQPDVILLGSPSDARLEAGEQHISARCYEGLLYGDAWVGREKPAANARITGNQAPPRAFSLRARLEGASLGRFARESTLGRQSMSGRIDGSLVLVGSSQGVRDMKGAGSVHLRDANLYELPVMLSLLKVLSLKEPDTTAFTTGDVDFLIHGAHGQVYLSRIDLHGDALSLAGRGSVGFDKQLALLFQPQLGSRGARVPIISDLLRSASGQIVELYVGGTVDQPDVSQEPFPGIKEALENLQPPILPPMAPEMNNSRPNPSQPRR